MPKLAETRRKQGEASRPARVNVFLSYAHRDERLRTELEKHLAPLRRSDSIAVWQDRRIVPGSTIDEEIQQNLNAADLILLLISPDFIASEYCYSLEMRQALRRHAKGEVTVIPIIMRPVDWHETPIGGLLALPKDGRPVTSWNGRRDEALLDVVRGVRRAVEEVKQRKTVRRANPLVPPVSPPIKVQ